MEQIRTCNVPLAGRIRLGENHKSVLIMDYLNSDSKALKDLLCSF